MEYSAFLKITVQVATKAQRLNMSLSPYLKSLPAIASRSGEAGGEEDNVPRIKRLLKE
jgi:hypothetical protein